MKKMILLGDSIYGKFKQPQLEEIDRKLRVKCVNAAYGGATSDDIAIRYGWLSKTVSPDFVSISIGINDANFYINVVNFKKNITRLLKAFKQSRVILLVPPPVDTIHNKVEGTEFNNRLKPYIDAIKGIASEYPYAYLIDLTYVYNGLLADKNDYHIEDGVHLNDKGFNVFIKGLSASYKLALLD